MGRVSVCTLYYGKGGAEFSICFMEGNEILCCGTGLVCIDRGLLLLFPKDLHLRMSSTLIIRRKELQGRWIF
jgi:hypothetical protein